MKRLTAAAVLIMSSLAFGQAVSNTPIEIYKTVKAAIAKITLSGKILQTCMTPIPSNQMQVQLIYVPADSALRERAAKEPVTRFDPDQGHFSRIIEIPEGDYRLRVINLRDNRVVGDQKIVVTSKDQKVDVLVDCTAK